MVPDEYTWRARVAPVLVVISPVVIFVTSSAFLRPKIAVGGTVVGAALLLLAAQLARDAGKRQEGRLWRAWGGAPTLRRLRFGDSANPASLERLHARLETVLGLKLPTEDEERRNEALANSTYEAAIGALREKTREKSRFPLVFSENADYGFRRNLFGLRWWGVSIAAITAVASLVLMFALPGSSEGRVVAYGISTGWAALTLLLCIFVVRPAWVRIPAEAYADRLMGSVELLE